VILQNEVEAKMKTIASKVIKKLPNTISRESRIKEDLGADSLDVVLLLFELENEFDISIPDEKGSGFKTVGDVVDYVVSVK